MDESLQALLAASNDDSLTRDAIHARLSRLLDAPSPNSGAILPGAVGDVIRAIADEFGLPISTDPRIHATGNLAIEIGAGDGCDILITAHMDRPTFRVLNLDEATLYPLCAIRVPGVEYSCDAINTRYTAGRVQVAGRGILHFHADNGAHEIRYETTTGDLQAGDSVQMHAPLQARGSLVFGAGLDNAAGLLIGLLAAKALQSLSHQLTAQNKKIIFAFTDQEEGPPIGLFGQGASRLLHAIGPPRLGFINVDGHNPDHATGHLPGIGASHAFVSGYGRGSVVPLDYQALATDLAAEINRERSDTVRLNYAYVSRSDDMLLSLGARCLGLVGVVLENAHTAEESISLSDLRSAAIWLSLFIRRFLSHAA